MPHPKMRPPKLMRIKKPNKTFMGPDNLIFPKSAELGP